MTVGPACHLLVHSRSTETLPCSSRPRHHTLTLTLRVLALIRVASGSLVRSPLRARVLPPPDLVRAAHAVAARRHRNAAPLRPVPCPLARRGPCSCGTRPRFHAHRHRPALPALAPRPSAATAPDRHEPSSPPPRHGRCTVVAPLPHAESHSPAYIRLNRPRERNPLIPVKLPSPATPPFTCRTTAATRH